MLYRWQPHRPTAGPGYWDGFCTSCGAPRASHRRVWRWGRVTR